MSDQMPPTGPNEPNGASNPTGPNEPTGPNNPNFGTMAHAQSAVGPNAGLWVALSSVMLVISVLCSCCGFSLLAIPFAIAGLVFAIQANTASKEHRFADSERKLKNAKLLTAIAAGVFVLGWIANAISGVSNTSWSEFKNEFDRGMHDATSTTVVDTDSPTVTTAPVLPADPTTAAN